MDQGTYYLSTGFPTNALYDYRAWIQNSLSFTGGDFRYHGPETGKPRGSWEVVFDGTTYSSYNAGTDGWAHPTTGGSSTFYPHLPPIPVSIHQDMISAYESLDTAGYASTIAAAVVPVEWTANSRDYAHHNDITYDTLENTAPLKITTAETQLLHDLAQNPNFTQTGRWQFKDITNNHTWEFNPSTGTWHNIASGYSWKYSKNAAGQWYQETVESAWVFDENTQNWNQVLTESS